MHAHTNIREAKVWQLVKTGNIANLKLHNTIIAPPKPSQVTVAVKAVRVNVSTLHFLQRQHIQSLLVAGWHQFCRCVHMPRAVPSRTKESRCARP